MLHKLFRSRPSTPAPAIPPGRRVYAIGDVHGRSDLLTDLLAQIDRDIDNRDPVAVSIVALGDLVDRGPDSRGTVDCLRRRSAERGDLRLLLGNHEEVFLGALDGDAKALRLFSRIGGRETMLSYGMGAEEYDALDFAELQTRMAALVPEEHRAFLASAEDVITIGDYAFVHAGVRPGVALADQAIADLRWIRSSFLDHRGPFEKMIVHGHTIVPEVDVRTNRIGIDTGAYASGRLTALALQGQERWVLQAMDAT